MSILEWTTNYKGERMFQNISSPLAPKAIGPYSQAVKLGDFVYLSGQLPIDPTTNELIEGGIMEQTYQVFQNMEAVLSEMDLELRHILKTTVFLTDINDFDAMNQIYATIMSAPYPARSTVQVAALPKNSKIEIECVVIDTLEYERAMQEHHHHHEHECKCGHDQKEDDETQTNIDTDDCKSNCCG